MLAKHNVVSSFLYCIRENRYDSGYILWLKLGKWLLFKVVNIVD